MSDHRVGAAHPHPEQDEQGDGDLPTYDDLSAQHAHEPNSRFGRWRSWIEKRAAERYADVSPAENARRRARGWEVHPEDDPDAPVIQPPTPTPMQGMHPHLQLRVQTDLTDEPPTPPPKDYPSPSGYSAGSMDGAPPDYPFDAYTPSTGPPSLPGEQLPPAHLRLHHFGSRFIPHTTSPIRCVLPLPVPGERLLLIGHDDGLSVLDMFPHQWTERGLLSKGPEEAQTYLIWEGEGVHQMAILEMEGSGESTPQGVVLVLVGCESGSPREHEGLRTIRMYSLASLISLAKWAVSQQDARPLDLRRPSNWNPQETPSKKKHRSHASFHGSIAKGLKSLILESPVTEKSPSPTLTANERSKHNSSGHVKSPSSGSGNSGADSMRPHPHRDNSANSVDTSWDVVDDLPLRWATDYVALATAGSRLSNLSVLSFELRLNEDRRTRGGALLAVATKSNILLYETPKGERAFIFVKEFYTPLCPRQITFIHQSVSQHRPSSERLRSADVSHNRRPSGGSDATLTSGHHYLPQVSLFVIFDKKAGLIRVADSAVGEIELHQSGEDEHGAIPSSMSYSSSASPGASWLSPTASVSGSSGFGRRSRSSFDGGLFGRESKGPWLVPVKLELPSPFASTHPSVLSTKSVYVLTRGKQTHVVPTPLPSPLAAHAPLRTFTWRTAPAHVTARVCHVSVEDGCVPHLQLVALGPDGAEVQELPVSAVLAAGKGKVRAEEPLYAEADVGGDAGFLALGGHWHRANANADPGMLTRAPSVMSYTTFDSFDSLEGEEWEAKMRLEQGLYGWVRKGAEDWRVFWLGGTGKDEPEVVED